MKILSYIKLLRPFNWTKNLLVFIPIFFAKELFVADKLFYAAIILIIFSLVASSVYIINDLIDREADQKHPIKKSRPLAAGLISGKEAIFILFLLLIIATTLIYKFFPSAILLEIIIFYFILNIAYSVWLKHIALFDIIAISVFYLLRILAGGVATETPVSRWLILSIIFVSLFIIISKRKAEMDHREHKRKVLEKYSADLLNQLRTVTLTLSLITYSLYTVLGLNNDLAIYSIFFALIGTFRYLAIVNLTKNGESPEKIIAKDPIILSSIVLWAIYMHFII